MHSYRRGEEEGKLSRSEAEDLAWADAIVRGISREDGREVYLVVEVSWSLGVGDVERAARRAKILGKLGVRALPVVAGKGIAEEADSAAREMGIHRVIDGKLLS